MNSNTKNILSILLISTFIIIIIFYFIKNVLNSKVDSKQEIIYDFGIISTISNKEDSVTSYYKFDGTLIERTKMKLAWLGISFGSFGETDKYIYTKVDNKNGTVFELNKINGNYKLYDLTYNALTMYAEDEYVYSSNSNIQYSTIIKYNTITNEIIEIEIERCIVLAVYPYMDNIYVSSIMKNGEAKIYILDKDSLAIKEIISNNISNGHYHILGVGNKVYFANNMDKNNEDGSVILSEYDIISGIMNYHTLNEPYLFDIFEYKDKLIITHLDPPLRSGNKITVFDLLTQKNETFTLENNLIQSTIKNDFFISHDNEYIYIYDLSEFSLVNKIHIGLDDYYVSTLFSK